MIIMLVPKNRKICKNESFRSAFDLLDSYYQRAIPVSYGPSWKTGGSFTISRAAGSKLCTTTSAIKGH
jgi:hypothetical protein